MGFLTIKVADIFENIKLAKYNKKVTNPSDKIYAKIKINKIPKGPILAGVVIFSKRPSKQRLTIVVIDIIVFSITKLL